MGEGIRNAKVVSLLKNPGDTIARVAEMYMSAGNVVIGWTMGITHHLHGVENVQMIANQFSRPLPA